ncbi:GtrA family protein [Aromatoleum toluolicum]|uniref:GtrA family protein n=1 Tax=Aromatoleum toluolicum TaxID=90060 RepID=A0ABX1NBV1_9RHOO|nr:GtrA family protein [Aromatoleum toluolicum]NMF96737.1 GtrA family protein [Aromatoleum toluolicum]
MSSKIMQLRNQFLPFLLIGGFATALHFVVLIALVQSSMLPPVPASSVGFGLSALLNYALNRHYTFESDSPHARALPRFAVVATSALGLNALLLYLMQGVFGIHYVPAQVVATSGTLIWNFALNRSWTFAATVLPVPQVKEPES